MNQYNKFALYYVEIFEQLRELKIEEDDLLDQGLAVPKYIGDEIFRHECIIEILKQAGQELYKKTPKQLFKDGYAEWFKEDEEIRSKNYGEKIIVRVKTND